MHAVESDLGVIVYMAQLTGMSDTGRFLSVCVPEVSNEHATDRGVPDTVQGACQATEELDGVAAELS
jgi:hypothetical protein